MISPPVISRTGAAWKNYPQVRENEALHIASIRAAKACIYMENQYFTSPLIAAELAKRLKEAEGPEVILVSTEHSPSYFDQLTMDKTRLVFIQTLTSADRHGRLRVYSPVTTLGRTIIVHAKLTIIDRCAAADRLGQYQQSLDGLRHRMRPVAGGLRDTLLAHWLGCVEDDLKAAIKGAASVGEALDCLRNAGYCRLRPIAPAPLKPLAAFIAVHHLGDPIGPEDSWRPWKRRETAKAEAAKARRLAGWPSTRVGARSPSDWPVKRPCRRADDAIDQTRSTANNTADQ